MNQVGCGYPDQQAKTPVSLAGLGANLGPAPRAGIAYQLKQISGAIESVEEAVKRLSERLDSVLCPSTLNQCEKNVRKVQPAMCSIAADAEGLAGRVADISAAIADLTERVDA